MDNLLLRRLREVLEDKKKKNPKFSLRAFARQTGIPAPTLSRLLAGRWNLSLAMARKIVRGISESPDEQKRLLRAFALEPEKKTARPTRYRHLTLKELEQLGHWGFGSVLEWMRGRDWVKSEEPIARATGLTEKEAFEILVTLKKHQLVERSLKLGWRSKETHLSSIRWEGEQPWIRIHKGYAERSAAYLENHEKTRSAFLGITFMVSAERIAEAKERIREFAEEISDDLSGGPEDELYRLNVQLFPLGK